MHDIFAIPFLTHSHHQDLRSEMMQFALKWWKTSLQFLSHSLSPLKLLMMLNLMMAMLRTELYMFHFQLFVQCQLECIQYWQLTNSI